ncbi:hypothetical protein BJV77DRAFT_1055028, partial [Russula vinacea]
MAFERRKFATSRQPAFIPSPDSESPIDGLSPPTRLRVVYCIQGPSSPTCCTCLAF